jgi:site-specific DNA recombinase
MVEYFADDKARALVIEMEKRHRARNALREYLTEGISYLRYSSHRQDGGVSLEYQIKEVLEYADRNQIKIVGWYIDTAKSATEVAGRDNFITLFDKVDRRDVPPNLIIFATNRAFRNNSESAQYRAILREKGVLLHSATQNIDESTSSGRMHVNMLSAIDQYQSETTSDFVSAATKYLISEGLFAGGTPPYGFKTDRIIYNGKERAVLVPNEEEAAIVRELFDFVLSGGAINQFAKILHQRGVIGRGGTPIYRESLRKMLSNIIYKGERIYRMKDGKHAYCADYCTPIVSKDIFDAANRAYEERPKTPQGRMRKNNFALTGKLVCSHCGSPYVGTTVRKYTYYICKGKYNHKKCPLKKLQKVPLERAVFNAIIENVFSNKAIEDITKKVLYIIKKSPAIAEDEATLKKRKLVLEDEIAEIVQMEIDKKYPESVLRNMSAPKISELSTIEHKLSQIKMSFDKTIDAAYIKKSIKSLFDRDVPFDKCSHDMLKALFSQTIDHIEINSTQVVLHLRINISPNKYKNTQGTPHASLSINLDRPKKERGL